jgi:hypothetical protein
MTTKCVLWASLCFCLALSATAAQANEKGDWAKACKQDSVQAYQKFLARYPQSTFRQEAEDRIIVVTKHLPPVELVEIRLGKDAHAGPLLVPLSTALAQALTEQGYRVKGERERGPADVTITLVDVLAGMSGISVFTIDPTLRSAQPTAGTVAYMVPLQLDHRTAGVVVARKEIHGEGRAGAMWGGPAEEWRLASLKGKLIQETLSCLERYFRKPGSPSSPGVARHVSILG